MYSYEDIEMFRQDTNSTSVMIGRAAMNNLSIIKKDKMLPINDVVFKNISLFLLHFLKLIYFHLINIKNTNLFKIRLQII